MYSNSTVLLVSSASACSFLSLARACGSGWWCPEHVLPASDNKLSSPAGSGSGINAETMPEVFLDTMERPEMKLEEMVFVGDLDQQALVWFLLLDLR